MGAPKSLLLDNYKTLIQDGGKLPSAQGNRPSQIDKATLNKIASASATKFALNEKIVTRQTDSQKSQVQ